MALPKISKNRRFFAKLATFWIPITKYRQTLRGILLLGGYRKWRNIIKTDAKRKFPYQFTVGAIMKDEGPYLKEWLDFHIMVGVDKFWLYDNESTDDTTKILAPYIEKGLVEYTYFPGKARQHDAYVDILAKHSEDTRWLALIDMDEFIVPVQHDTVPEFLETLPRTFWAVVMTWVLYGSSGHKTKPEGLLIENYKWRAAKQTGIKAIINPRLAVCYDNPHLQVGGGFIVDENGKKLGHIDQTRNPPSYNLIRLNHYVTKSYEEYVARHARGPADGNPRYMIYRAPDKFKEMDKSEVYDDTMDKYVQRLKKQ